MVLSHMFNFNARPWSLSHHKGLALWKIALGDLSTAHQLMIRSSRLIGFLSWRVGTGMERKEKDCSAMSCATLSQPRGWINNSSSNWAPKPSRLPEIRFPPFRSAAAKSLHVHIFEAFKAGHRSFLGKMSHIHWTNLLKTTRNCVLAREGNRKIKRTFFDEGVTLSAVR